MTDTTTEFSLYGFVQRIAAEESMAGNANRRDITERILAEIPADQIAAALALTMPQYVNSVLGEFRKHPGRILGVGKQPFTPSGRVVSQRTMWQAVCARNIAVEHGFKTFGECTVSDLLYAIDQRRIKAKEHQRWADHYEQVIVLLTESHRERVSDLPQAAQQRIIQDFEGLG